MQRLRQLIRLFTFIATIAFFSSARAQTSADIYNIIKVRPSTITFPPGNG